MKLARMRTCGGGGTRETAVERRFPVALLHLRPRPSDAALPLLLMVVPSLSAEEAPYMAAPGTAIGENERDGQHWGRHLPHGVTVARFESRVG